MVRDIKRSFLAVGVFLLPTVVVWAAALLTGQGGPQSAKANQGGSHIDPQAFVEPYVAVWSADQRTAAQYAASLRSQPFGPSPLLHQVQPRLDPTPSGGEPELAPPPDVVVQLILRSARGNIAVIESKRYREGDAIGDAGWIVNKIDRRSVSLVHPETAREHTLTVPLPMQR